MTWDELFERARGFDVDLEGVHEAVECDRGDDGSDR